MHKKVWLQKILRWIYKPHKTAFRARGAVTALRQINRALEKGWLGVRGK